MGGSFAGPGAGARLEVENGAHGPGDSCRKGRQPRLKQLIRIALRRAPPAYRRSVRPRLDLLLALGLALAGIALNAPYLTGGFTMDDYVLVRALQEEPLRFSRWSGVWSLREVEAFQSLWWSGADWEGRLFRPLASLVLEGSLGLFGPTAAPLHALALLCHGLAAAGLFLLLSGLGAGRPKALLAALFFLGCERLTLVVGWVSTITDPLALVGMTASLLAHRRFLQERGPWLALLSLLGFAFALGCKESAIVQPALLGLLTLAAPRGVLVPLAPGRVAERLRGALRDLVAWAPAAALGAGFLIAYRALGLGAMHNLAYASPLSDSAGFLQHALVHLPVLWLGSLTSVWPSFGMFLPELLPGLAVAGALTLAALLPELWRRRQDPLVLLSGAGWLLALLPQVSADASERGLYVPVFLLAPLLATLALGFGPLGRRLGGDEARAPPPATAGSPGPRPAAGERPTPLYGKLWGAYATLGLLAPGLVLTPLFAPMMKESFAQGEREVLTALPHLQARAPRELVLLDTSGFGVALAPQSVFQFHGVTVPVHVLSAANGAFVLTRLDASTLRLSVDRDGWLTNFFARLVRTNPVLRVGQTSERGAFTATIEALSPDGGDVRAVRFSFARPLSDRAGSSCAGTARPSCRSTSRRWARGSASLSSTRRTSSRRCGDRCRAPSPRSGGTPMGPARAVVDWAS